MTEVPIEFPLGMSPQTFEAAKPLLERLPFAVMYIDRDYSVLWANLAATRRFRGSTGNCHECMHGDAKPCGVDGNQLCHSLEAAQRHEVSEMVHVRSTETGVELFKVVAMPMGRGVLEFHIPIDESFSRDSLTGLLNRPAIEKIVRQNVELLRRLKQQGAVMILDLDHFKRINDRFGHAGGDAYLKAVGALLKRELRNTDVVGRWGGEEFLVFMPGTDRRGAGEKAMKLLAALRDLRVDHHGASIHTTSSAGIWAGFPRCSFDKIYEDADAALYRAKSEGRNRLNFAFENGFVPPTEGRSASPSIRIGQG